MHETLIALVLTGLLTLLPAPHVEKEPELPPEPPPVVAPVTYPVKVPILLYHHIAPAGLKIPYNDMIITPEQFENQLKILHDFDYKSVSLRELYQYYQEGTMPEEKLFVISFDDGYESNYIYGFPILKKYNMKAHINVVVNKIQDETTTQFNPEKLTHLSWEQMKEMLDSGLIEFYSHTNNQHFYEVTDNKLKAPALTNKVYLYKEKQFESDKEWKRRIYDDLLLAKSKLKFKLGIDAFALAYPYGDYNEEVIKIAQEVGYELGLTVNEGVVTGESKPYEWERVAIRPYDNLATFMFKVYNIKPQ